MLKKTKLRSYKTSILDREENSQMKSLEKSRPFKTGWTLYQRQMVTPKPRKYSILEEAGLLMLRLLEWKSHKSGSLKLLR